MLYFIDTNIFLRILIKENPKTFLESTKLLEAIKENKLDAYTGTIVLSEAAYTLKSYYKFKKEKIIEALRGIVNIRGLKIRDNYNQDLALDLFDKYSIKYIDALIASNEDIFTKKTTVVSYDQEFDKLPLIRQEPKEVITPLASHPQTRRV